MLLRVLMRGKEKYRANKCMREYKIIDIRDCKDAIFGDTKIVRANPVRNESTDSDQALGKTFVRHIYVGTTLFQFPKNLLLVKALELMAQSDDLWLPNIKNFEIDFVDINGQQDQLIYRHHSLFSHGPKFKIIDIRDSEDDIFGQTETVRANPIQNNVTGKLSYRSFVSHIYEDTAIFIFPRDEALMESLIQIAQSDDFWAPDFREYEIARVTYNGQPQQLVYRHISLENIRAGSVSISNKPLNTDDLMRKLSEEAITKHFKK